MVVAGGLKFKLVLPFVKFIIGHADACVVAGTKAREFYLRCGADPKKLFVAYNCAVDYGRRSGNLKRGVALLVCGDGEFRQYCERLSAEMGVKNVRYVGQVQDEKIPAYYATADAFVLPTRSTEGTSVGYEAWGLTLNEAMSIGKSVIATTAVGGAYDLIENGKNGYMVAEGDTEALYSAIKKIMDDKGLREKMGKESLRRIRERFNCEEMAKAFSDAIKSVQKS